MTPWAVWGATPRIIFLKLTLISCNLRYFIIIFMTFSRSIFLRHSIGKFGMFLREDVSGVPLPLGVFRGHPRIFFSKVNLFISCNLRHSVNISMTVTKSISLRNTMGKFNLNVSETRCVRDIPYDWGVWGPPPGNLSEISPISSNLRHPVFS